MKKLLFIISALLLLFWACTKDPVVGDFNPFDEIPKGLTASTDRLDSTIHISWNSVDDASGYNLRRTDDPIEGSYELIASETVDTTYIDRNVTLGRSYYYIVSAVFESSSDTSVSSEKVMGVALIDKEDDEFPEVISLSATDGRDLDGVGLSWSSCGAEASYDLYVSAFGEGEYKLLKEKLTGTTFEHADAVPGPLTYKVIAYNSKGDSLDAIDEGYRLVTPKEFFLEVNKTYKYSQNKIGKLKNEDLGEESAGGDIHGTLSYNSYMSGLKVKVDLTYDNYKDYYLTLNGKQFTLIDGLFSKSGTVTDTVTVMGIYEGFVDHHITVDDGDPNGGHYTVGVVGVDTADVQFADVKDAVLD